MTPRRGGCVRPTLGENGLLDSSIGLSVYATGQYVKFPEENLGNAQFKWSSRKILVEH